MGGCSGPRCVGRSRHHPAAPSSCTTASIFADCFSGCSGILPADGTVCGWSFTEPFGVFGGTVAFTPGSMKLTSTDGNFWPAAVKTPGNPVSVLGISVQFSFAESATVPLTDGAAYSFYMVDSTGANALILFLDDLDNVFFQAGPVGGVAQYTGAWTPDNGAHVVSLSVDGLGVPTLQIDAEVITLTPGAAIPVAIGTMAVNTVSFFFSAAVLDTDPHFMDVTKVFVTAGAVPAGTEFCCP